MIVTEEQAKTIRCQEGFAASDGVTPGPIATTHYNVPMPSYGAGAGVVASASMPTAPMFCLGTGCMAWCWHDDQQYESGTPLQEGVNPAEPGWEKFGAPYREQTTTGIVMWQRWRRPLPGRRGYCGKARR